MKYDMIRGRPLNYFFIIAGLTLLVGSCQSDSKTKTYESKISLDSISYSNYNHLEKIIIEQK